MTQGFSPEMLMRILEMMHPPQPVQEVDPDKYARALARVLQKIELNVKHSVSPLPS